MKICYVSSEFHFYDYRFLETLSKNRYQVKVVAFKEKPFVIPDKFKNLENISYKIILPVTKYYKLLGCLNLVFKIIQLKIIIKKFKPDILHGGYIRTDGYYCALTGFHPFLLMVWGSDILLDPFENLRFFLKTKFTIRRADLITCDCKYQKEYVCKIGRYDPHKVITFSWGIDLNFFSPDKNSRLRKKFGWDDKIILIMNRGFQQVYGHKYFIKAFKILIEKYDNIRLFLLHDGPLKEEILSELNSYGLAEYYKYIGIVSEEKMALYLNASDIWVSASLSDGVSCSLLEAMACGLPVITTDIMVNYEWIRNGINGFIVEKASVDALVEKIETLILNKDLREEMSKNNMALGKERANWNNNFKILEKIYKSLNETV